MRVPQPSSGQIDQFLSAARPFWHPVARSVDIKAGTTDSVRLLSEELVLWRDTAGRLAAADDVCPHRGTKLSTGSVTEDGCLQCPYHLFEYSVDGSCTAIPQLPGKPISPKVRLNIYGVVDYAGLVWVCLDAEAGALTKPPIVPMVESEGWWSYAGKPPVWNCQAPRMMENFLDLAHFGAIHGANFGNPDIHEVASYKPVVHKGENAITYEVDYLARYRWAPPTDGKPAIKPIHYRYRCDLPFASWIESNPEGEARYYTFIACQPVSINETRIFWVTTFPDETQRSPAELDEGFLPFFSEDQVIVEQQRPEWLPLDVTDELHLPFDKISVAYRRGLAELGFPTVRLPRP